MDFLTLDLKYGKNGAIDVSPDFIVRKSKDLMIRGNSFYAVWNEETGLWSTDMDDVIQMVDKAVKDKVTEMRKAADGSVRGNYMRYSSSGIVDKWVRYTTKQMQDNYHPLDAKLTFANTPVQKKDYISKRLPYNLEAGDTSAWQSLLDVLYSPEEQHKIEWMIGSIVSGDSKKNQKFFVFYGSSGTGKGTILDIIAGMFDGYWTAIKASDLGSTTKDFALEPFKDDPLIAIDFDGNLSKIQDNSSLNTLVSHEKIRINEKFKSQYTIKPHSLIIVATNRPVKITDAKSGLLRRLIDIHPTGNTIKSDEYNDLMAKVKFEYGAIAQHCLDVYLENRKYYNGYVPEIMFDETNDFYNFIEEYGYVYAKSEIVGLSDAWADYKTYCENANVYRPMGRPAFKAELKNYFDEFYKDYRVPDTNEHLSNVYKGFNISKFVKDPELNNKPAEKKTESWLEFKEQESLFDKEFADCPAQYSVVDEESGNTRPQYKWSNCKTKLKDLDTSKEHYVKTPETVLYFDFDIKGDDGEKNFEKNLEAASKLPPTYGELSKSGVGIHLVYRYEGDISKLSSLYSENVEIKTFPKDQKGAIRRKLTKCNNLSIATINSGLPLKGEKKKVVNEDVVKSEAGLRKLIVKNLNKEIHPNTKPSVDFIYKILDDAYNSGLEYDVSDMKPAVLYFAGQSSHQSNYCLGLVAKMQFKSKDKEELPVVETRPITSDLFTFFDIESFPNYLCNCYITLTRDYILELTKMDWKDVLKELEKLRDKAVKEINPTPQQIRSFVHKELIGFNCRKYDNHILYARMNGYSLEQCYKLSHKIINEHTGYFGSAYDISKTDVYDFSSKKQSLKKFEIEMGFEHLENEYPWDEPLDESHWDEVADYCVNDVLATVGVFVKRYGDFLAREILSALSGLNLNATTNQHTTRIIFGTEKHPGLVYTDLSTGKQYGPDEKFEMPIVDEDYYYEHKDDWKALYDIPQHSMDYYDNHPEEKKVWTGEPTVNLPKNCFPGYFLVRGKDGKLKNMYRGVDLGFGGYVYANPGMYLDGAVTEDVASEHPHSMKEMNIFGKHTQKFVDLMDARIFIKHKDYESAKKLFGGKLAPYLDDPEQAKALSKALKIAINSVYGLTSAKFDNPFRDARNVNNIVALRGALFMKTVQDAVEFKGFHVIHIKTDSIKIENPTDYILNYVVELGKKYGYTFEVEHTWDRLCLVNNAVLIGKHGADDPDSPGAWDAVGTQFQIPYIYKTLFTHEEIEFRDMCETKSVTTALYLDCREGLPDVSEWEQLDKVRDEAAREIAKHKSLDDIDMDHFLTGPKRKFLEDHKDITDEKLKELIAKGHNRQFVGKVGSFCPMQAGCGAGELVRKNKDRNGLEKFDSATGAKWREDGKEVNRWMEANTVKATGKEKFIDRTYYRNLVDDAIATINQFGNYEDFIA